MLDNWTYKEEHRYSGDDISYEKAMDFLDEYSVEDWGCGTCWAKKFAKVPYKGIDGSGTFADIKADLREYKSETPCLLMRHILEHNLDWEKVLVNALESFTKKMALVIFTPFSNETKQIAWNEQKVPDMSFKKEDLTSQFNCKFTEETFPSKTQYGTETIFYLTK